MNETIKLQDAQPGDVIHIGGNDFPVLGVDTHSGMRIQIGDSVTQESIFTLQAFGATVTRPARPLPDWRGAVIESADRRHYAILLDPDDPTLGWVDEEGNPFASARVADYLGQDWRLVSRPITDDMVERGAKAARATIWNSAWESLPTPVKDLNRNQVRAALEAALGGE